MNTYLISACLLGETVRYNAQHCLNLKLQKLKQNGQVIVLCPEVFGGLPIPRLAAEIVGGDGGDVLSGQAHVINTAGENVSQAFIPGALQALHLAQRH